MKESKLTTGDKELILLVVKGKKPGCNVAISDGAKKLARTHNLEWVASTPAIGADLAEEPTRLEIGIELNAVEVIKQIGLPNIPKLYRRIEQQISGLNIYSVAQALADLSSCPRIDSEFPMVQGNNWKRPEVAVLQGMLYGYNLCCIEYATKAQYFNEPMVEWVENIWEIGGDTNPHTRCETCTIKLLDKLGLEV